MCQLCSREHPEEASRLVGGMTRHTSIRIYRPTVRLTSQKPDLPLHYRRMNCVMLVVNVHTPSRGAVLDYYGAFAVVGRLLEAPRSRTPQVLSSPGGVVCMAVLVLYAVLTDVRIALAIVFLRSPGVVEAVLESVHCFYRSNDAARGRTLDDLEHVRIVILDDRIDSGLRCRDRDGLCAVVHHVADVGPRSFELFGEIVRPAIRIWTNTGAAKRDLSRTVERQMHKRAFGHEAALPCLDMFCQGCAALFERGTHFPGCAPLRGGVVFIVLRPSWIQAPHWIAVGHPASK